MIPIGNRGTTVLELIIAATLFSGIVAGGYTLLGSGVDAYDQGGTAVEVERHADRLLQLVVAEISQAGRDVTYPRAMPPNSSHTLTLQRCTGYTAGAKVWSTPTTLEFRHLPDELDDGKDNNGNGLIDEGMLVRVDDAGGPNERVTALGSYVREYMEGEEKNGTDDNGNGLIDEPGVSFDVVGDVWTVRITIERRDGNGRLITHTAQTSIKVRN